MYSKALALLVLLGTSNSFATIDRFIKVSPSLYRGAQPSEVSDYQMMKGLGIKSILNLRDDGASEKAVAEKTGFKFLFFPMNAFSYPDDTQVNQILAAMKAEENQPVFVHCQYGKDRTGLLVALSRFFFEKWPAKQAYDEMVKMGFNQLFINLRHYYQWKTNSRLPLVPGFSNRMLNPWAVPPEFDNSEMPSDK